MSIKKLMPIFMMAILLAGGAAIMSYEKTKTTEWESEQTNAAYVHPFDSQMYDGDDLGATYSQDQTVFKVWSPGAQCVKVRLYLRGSDAEDGAGVLMTKSMTKGENGIWQTSVEGDQRNRYYTYLVTVDGQTNETPDIYAKAVGVNGNRSMIVDLASTDPEGWDSDTHILLDSPTDAVVWEIHVRDFSIDASSGVSEQNRGKYLAFAETGTTLNAKGEVPTCLDYLRQLGITHIQLLPSYDYATVDESNLTQDQFNWGYDPKNYNVPEGYYSTNPFDGSVRITEFKKMVQSLHSAGIGVIMDVVYNHTYTATGGAFEMTVPGYYYRMKEDGTFSNASGCGNETASDHLMYRKYMIDSVLYWIKEYHIDGFRFDLMGVHDVETMNALRNAVDSLPNGDKIILYGEPWTGGTLGTVDDTCVKDNIKKLSTRIGAFNDNVRDAIKGDVFVADIKGFVQGCGDSTAVVGGLTGNCLAKYENAWFSQPSQTVTYVSAHDNYTLYDKLVLSSETHMDFNTRDESIVAMNKLAAAMVMTSQGMPFMQAGEEFARTKFGDENSFASSTEINSLKWDSLVKYADLAEYYKGLMQIRANFAPFRDSTTASAQNMIFSETSSPNMVAYTLEDKNAGQNQWGYIASVFNAESTAQTVVLKAEDGQELPDEWVIVADEKSAGTENLGSVVGDTVTVGAKSALILVDKMGYESASSATDEETEESVDSAAATLTVEYLLEDGTEAAQDYTAEGSEGTEYTALIKQIDGLELDIDKFPANAIGTFGTEDITVTYYYKETDDTELVIHYKPSSAWDEIGAYVYYTAENGNVALSDKLPGTQMTADGDGWYTVTVSKPEDVDEIKVYFTDMTMTGEKDRGEDSSDYIVSGEVWIQNGKIYSTGAVYTIYMDAGGSILDTAVSYGMADGETTYQTEEKDFKDLVMAGSTSNTIGVYTETPIYVIYVYDTPSDTEEKTVPTGAKAALLACIGGAAVTLAAAGAVALFTRKKRRKL